MATIKDLDSKTDLGTIIVKTPSGKIGRIKGSWKKGVWLQGHSSKLHPEFLDDIKEILEWEVVEDPSLINLK